MTVQADPIRVAAGQVSCGHGARPDVSAGCFGYAQDVDGQVHDPPGEPADQANEGKGLRALFRAAGSAGQSGTASEPAQAGAGSGRPAAGNRAAERGPAATGALPDAWTRPARQQDSVRPLVSRPLVSRPLISPRLRADPRLRVWVIRAVVAVALYIGFTIGLGWRYGLTAAVIYAAADTVFRSKTAAVVPASVRITSAQRFTRRRMRILRPAGYHALHTRTIPGTKHVIDHVVIGPAGVFTLDSQRLDRRLPLRMIGGMLYHGRASMEGRIDHAAHEAGHAARLIGDELGRPVAVRPVMVTYGPNTSWMIMKLKGVDVLDGSRIGTYFRRQANDVKRRSQAGQRRLTGEQIEVVLAAAERALPPLA